MIDTSNMLTLSECGLSIEDENALKEANLAVDINKDKPDHCEWWWVSSFIFNHIGRWHDEGHPCSFTQLTADKLRAV